MITLPKLPFQFDALEPYVDAKTMEIHYTKHHQAYIDKLNVILKKYPKLESMKPEDMLKNIKSLSVDEKDRIGIRNNAGGHVNHTFFWSVMGSLKTPDLQLIKKINGHFGSVDSFKKLFTDTAVNHFGSGWAWLTEDSHNELEIYSLPNQDSPYTLGHTPLIGLDVWEHAYYLSYQNRRAEYINNWWKVLKLL